MNTKPEKQKATLIDSSITRRNARNLGRDKETVATVNVVAYSKGELLDVVIARWYMGRSRDPHTVGCSVWVSEHRYDTDRKRHYRSDTHGGHGAASGYGHHRNSAALDSAITSAGFKLTLPIDGRGDTAVEEALLAIARGMGYRKLLLVRN